MGYWDTSCLLKLYVREPDAALFERHVGSGARLVTGEITRMEMWAALRRKEADGDLAAGGAQDALDQFDHHVAAGRITILSHDSRIATEYENVVDQCYRTQPAIYIRTLDALHLASARELEETEMVTTDRRLREAARLFGFTLFPPEPPPLPTSV